MREQAGNSSHLARLLLLSAMCAVVGCGESEAERMEKRRAAFNVNTTRQDQDAADPKPDQVAGGETIENSIGMKLVKIPSGEFVMGSFDDEIGRAGGEFQRTVKIEKPFYIGIYEVTQEEYVKVMGENPSTFPGARNPVDGVWPGHCLEFCARLSKQENQTYRLPTEAEWEYACRAGTKTAFHYGNRLGVGQANFNTYHPYRLNEIAPPPTSTVSVGRYEPNAFGLFDMHGNVFEWCLDIIPDSTNQHIKRGGAFNAAGCYCRSAYRMSNNRGSQFDGFRVVRTVEPESGEIKFPAAPPLDSGKHTSNDVIAKIDEAFAKPPVALLPRVLVFPAVDASMKVRDDGVGISLITSMDIESMPQNRTATCSPSAINRLLSAGCLKPGTVIDDDMIKICTASTSAERYVVPQVVDDAGKQTLKFQLYQIDKTPVGTEGSIPVAEQDFIEIPGRFARGILEQLGAKLSEPEIKQLATPEISNAAALSLLGRVALVRDIAMGHPEVGQFVDENPGCLAGWMLFLHRARSINQYYATKVPNAVLDKFDEQGAKLNCDRLKILSTYRKQMASQDDFLALLELAPKFQKDPQYHAAIGDLAIHTGDANIVGHLLEKWSALDPSYAAYVSRGQFLADWALRSQSAMGGVDKEGQPDANYQSRFQQARVEFEKAIEANPLGWDAHSRLISVLMYTGDRDPIDVHFEKAIEIRPLDVDTYTRRLESLQTWWGGEPDEMLLFALNSIGTDDWENGIAQVGLKALDSIGFNPYDFTQSLEAYQQPEIWKTLVEYHDGVQKSDVSNNLKAVARNLYAKVGATAGHTAEVADAFRQLEKDGIHRHIFWDGFTYPYLRDLVFSQHETGQIQNRAAVRIALDKGDLEAAESLLKNVQADSPESTAWRDRMQLAIETGRLLRERRSLELSSEKILALFDGIDSNWKIENGDLLCTLPPGGASTILFPIGIQNAEITGTLFWTGNPIRVHVQAHTRALRDNTAICYLPQAKYAAYRRGTQFLNDIAKFDSRPTFRLLLSEQRDVLEPYPGVTWEAPVPEHSPSGFGIQVEANDEGKSFLHIVGGIRIRLLD